MITIVHEASQISVPEWVSDLESFCRWIEDENATTTGEICFLQGQIWIDMSKEQLFTHNQVKTELTIVLGALVKKESLGFLFSDGALVTNEEADLACGPDVTFVSHDSLKQGTVRLQERREEGFVEIQGSPDLVVEVMSRSSIQKDTVQLRESYFEAGVKEYWLIDARGEEIQFDLLKRNAKGFRATRKRKGWLKSVVFDHSFRMDRTEGPLGQPAFHLEVSKS